ncbi:DUF202 domain containing protein [Lactarius tabidus]
MSSQPDLGPEFSISSRHGSPKSRSRSPVKHDSLKNLDDDAVNQQSGSSSNPQRTIGGPSAPSSNQKTGNVAAASTVLPFSLSLTLKNTGSVARDHLASERTFLAYVRTSLSFASAGVALVQLFRVSVSTSANGSLNIASAAQYARPLGATLIALGFSVLGLGTLRYFAIQRALPRGLFPAARLSIFVQAVALAALIGVVFGILVVVH